MVTPKKPLKPAKLIKKDQQQKAMSSKGQDEAILKAIARLSARLDVIADNVLDNHQLLEELHKKFDEIHPVVEEPKA